MVNRMITWVGLDRSTLAQRVACRSGDGFLQSVISTTSRYVPGYTLLYQKWKGRLGTRTPDTATGESVRKTEGSVHRVELEL